MDRLKGHQHGSQRTEIIDGQLSPLNEQLCTKCNQIKNGDCFYIRKDMTRTYSWCKNCLNQNTHKWRKTKRGWNTERNTRILRQFGITTEQYDQILTSQNNVCKICNQSESFAIKGTIVSLAIDHCHKTGVIRGLLCRRCNQVLGLLNDDPELINRCADYLIVSRLEYKKDK